MKRKRIVQFAKSFAWAISAIAFFSAIPKAIQIYTQSQKHTIFSDKSVPSAGSRIDPITTGSLRGLHLIPTVSQAQLQRLVNAEIAVQLEYSQDQLETKILQLNEMGAVKAKCFRAKPYSVNAVHNTEWRKIDYALVDEYIDVGSPENTPMSREKIMADIWLVREAALQSENTPQRFRTFGLYLLQVQDTLINAHQHFGEDGFKWAQKLVRTEYDYELAEQIKYIIPSKFYTHRLNQNMQLFSQSVTDFIPCPVRAQKLLLQKRQSS